MTDALERVADSFKSEAGNVDDVGAMLFGREAEQGVHLMQLLDQQYAVVVTNPPYMGSKNMDVPLRKYVEKYYAPGKRDLCTTFMLRNLELCISNGRVAMVTTQSWMFLRSYVNLRALPEKQPFEVQKKGEFTGILRETSIEVIAHLGRYAFSEIDVPDAPILLTFKHAFPISKHKLWACRLTARRASEEQAVLLTKATQSGKNMGLIFTPHQINFLSILETPIVYWLQPHFFSLLKSSFRLINIADTRVGLQTSDNERFLRCFWEIQNFGIVSPSYRLSGRWFWFAKAHVMRNEMSLQQAGKKK